MLAAVIFGSGLWRKETERLPPSTSWQKIPWGQALQQALQKPR
jgi:hypothetical protein